MNPNDTLPRPAASDDFVGAVAVLVFLIGTATGNALVLLGLSLITLAVFAVFYRHRLGKAGILIGVLAALVAGFAGLALVSL